MNKLAGIAVAQMVIGGSMPYKPTFSYESKSPKPKSKKARPLTKVIYYTDEKGQIKRKRVSLEVRE